MRQTHTLVKIMRSIDVADKTEWLTAEQIAQELGVHPETIREYIRDGLLKAVQLKRSYRIRRSDYEDFLRRRETGQR
jgi:excisionase family DNA binding protein